jgi:peptide/nickel transport system substrate-binding protein
MIKRLFANAGLVALAVLILILAACGAAATPEAVEEEEGVGAPAVEAEAAETTTEEEPAVEEAAAPAEEEAEEDSKRGGTVIVGHRQEPDRFWGPITGLTLARENAMLMNHTLIGIDDELGYFPILLEEVPALENGGIAEDGLTWTLHLRDDVKWHDGEPFNSEDVKFTWEAIMMEGTDVRDQTGWNRIESVATPDDQTVVLNFAEMDAPFHMRMAQVEMLPEHILGGLPAEELMAHEWFRAPVGTGPFKFVEWVPGSHIEYARNDDYFRVGQPYLDKIIFKIVPDANTLLNQLETGDVDIVIRVQDDQVEIANTFPGVETSTVQSLTPWLIWLNVNHPSLQDVRTRQALSHAIDREFINKEVYRGLSEPAYGPISPQLWAYNPDIPKYLFDPEKAKALLEEVGWKDEDGDGIREAHGVEGVEDGTPLTFDIANIAGEQIRVQLLSLVQAQWKEVGIDAELNLVDVGTMFGNMHPNNDFRASYSYIARPVDPDFGFLYLDRERFENRNNYTGFSDERVDDYIVCTQTTFDRAKRKECFFEAQEIIAEQVPQIFIGWRANTTGINERVQGYKPAPGWEENWNASEWWVEDN